MQDRENPPAPQWGLKSCTKRGRVLDCTGKEFKSTPELETKGAFMRGGVELQSQRWLPFGDRERES